MRIPLVDLRAQHETLAAELWPAVKELVLRQEFILGEAVERFERTLAKIFGVEHAVGVASGTDALRLSLVALGIGHGDAVLAPALSFVATAEAIVAAGAVPLFVDVDGFTLSANGLEERLARLRRRADGGLEDDATGARVRAVLPVHLFGQCAEMEAIGELARRHDLRVIEDAAQAIGATRKGRPAGSFGEAGCVSFFPSKNLGGWGDGGAIVTRDSALASLLRKLRAHGGPSHERLGTNSRLDALQATVLDVKTRHLPAWLEARARAASRYRELFAGVEGVRLPPREPPADRHAYHQFVLRVPHRDALIAHLDAQGIESRAYYPRPLHEEPCFAPFLREPLSLPFAEEAARTAIGIPIYPEITPDQQREVVAAVASFPRSL